MGGHHVRRDAARGGSAPLARREFENNPLFGTGARERLRVFACLDCQFDASPEERTR